MSLFVIFRYPSQKDWQRKEQLYLKIIDYFDKDKQWEHAIPLCKELCELYEKKVFDYAKLSGILRKQAGLFEKVISSNEEGLRFDPEYFRVGFYGQGFPLFLRVSLFLDANFSYYVHYANLISERLLNKPYVNEVSLRGQNPPLKCC